ncbi:hypothetical protein FGO68_gene6846 [Halteria grandinella]|uniref:Uncharacterized protein n=1 Tax=Halteria grandinella TaxID=5974 RepID=A0A8J8NBP2_HALGN|nr:hypothetical protein FGO68_gene6846 [Halteria grandinella]
MLYNLSKEPLHSRSVLQRSLVSYDWAQGGFMPWDHRNPPAVRVAELISLGYGREELSYRPTQIFVINPLRPLRWTALFFFKHPEPWRCERGTPRLGSPSSRISCGVFQDKSHKRGNAHCIEDVKMAQNKEKEPMYKAKMRALSLTFSKVWQNTL